MVSCFFEVTQSKISVIRSRLPATPAENRHPIVNLARLLRSDLQEHAPWLSHLRRSVCESLAHHFHPNEPLLPLHSRLQLEEFLKRIPCSLPRAPDGRQHLVCRCLARSAVLGVAGIVFRRSMRLVELQSLSTRTVDAGAGTR